MALRSPGVAIGLAIALLLPACTAGKPVLRPSVIPASAFERGVLYPSWQAGEYAGAESDATLAEMVKPLGVTWVAIVVTCYQETVTTTTIDCQSGGTATDDDLTHAIDVAHRQGLKVMLTPHIDPRDYPMHWRGDITFGDDTAAWRAWFAGYTAFITHYAMLARTTGAESFVVGTELPGASGHAREWREIVRAVRLRYPGMLTYAANHGEETSIQWWDALDAIGVDGYYALTQRNDPTLAELRAAWQPITARLEDLAGRWQRPILLTEIGYQSRAGTNRAPWGIDTDVADVQAQAVCYQAVFDSFTNRPWLLGMFWWNIRPRRDQGGPSDTDYTPIGKPAATVLRGNFARPP